MGDGLRTDDARLRRAGTRAEMVAAVMLFGTGKGMPLADLEAAAGVGLADLVDPHARLPDATLGGLWRAMSQRYPGEAIGLEMAAAAPLTVFGALAQAARHCESRLDALHVFVRYDKALSGGLDIHLYEEGGQVALELRHTLDATDGGHGAEAALALGARLGEEVIGQPMVHGRVEFAHAPNAALSVYEAWFGAHVRFHTGRNAVVFDAETLSGPPTRPDPTLFRAIEAHLDLVHTRLLAKITEEPLDRVRAAIAERAHQSRFDAEGLARSLGMSLRSLQRHTQRHGARLRDLIDEVREAQARELLREDRLSVDEVAFLVGYADDRAFRRAFKRWTGRTPAAHRAALR